MNTKKKLVILALALICLSVAVGGTMAAVAKEGDTHNVITSSGVDITLQEWQLVGGKREEYPEDAVVGVMPNTAHSKIVEVKNDRYAADAWVRVKVVPTITLADETVAEHPETVIDLDVNTRYWHLNDEDGYYYYLSPLEPNEVTKPLFEEVQFLPTMGNEYQESTVDIEVIAEAVQCAHNGNSALQAKGWPNSAE